MKKKRKPLFALKIANMWHINISAPFYTYTEK
jgi:hypothetical protein